MKSLIPPVNLLTLLDSTFPCLSSKFYLPSHSPTHDWWPQFLFHWETRTQYKQWPVVPTPKHLCSLPLRALLTMLPSKASASPPALDPMPTIVPPHKILLMRIQNKFLFSSSDNSLPWLHLPQLYYVPTVLCSKSTQKSRYTIFSTSHLSFSLHIILIMPLSWSELLLEMTALQNSMIEA